MQQLRRGGAADSERVEDKDREDHVVRDTKKGRRQPRENEEVIDDCNDQEAEDLGGKHSAIQALWT